MATKESPRIRGKKLGFKLDGTDFWVDMTGAHLTKSEDDDTVTFASLQAGGVQRDLKMAGIQSTAKGSLCRFLFDHANETVDFVLSLHGNETPTADEPHIQGRVTLGDPPDIGTEVQTTSVFEVQYPCETWEWVESAAGVGG